MLRDQAGYSLVEVIVSILLLAIAIIPMVAMFDAGLRASVLGSNYDKARTLANSNLEEIKARDFSDVAALTDCPSDIAGDTPSGFDCQLEKKYLKADLSETASTTGRMRVDVTVKWEGGGKSFETSGVIAKGTV